MTTFQLISWSARAAEVDMRSKPRFRCVAPGRWQSLTNGDTVRLVTKADDVRGLDPKRTQIVLGARWWLVREAKDYAEAVGMVVIAFDAL